MVFAVDVNRGRLRILKEAAKSHQVDGVITTIHADLRTLTVCHIISYVILNSGSAIVYFLSVSFVFPRTVNHLRVAKFCWMLHAQDLVFFRR